MKTYVITFLRSLARSKVMDSLGIPKLGDDRDRKNRIKLVGRKFILRLTSTLVCSILYSLSRRATYVGQVNKSSFAEVIARGEIHVARTRAKKITNREPVGEKEDGF